MNFLHERYPLANYPRHSRIHPLTSLTTTETRVFVKREDEIGPFSLGTKLRKYLSLIPFLAKCRHEIALIGGPYSNHILALCLLLNENKLPYTLFLYGPAPQDVQGNYLFTRLATPLDKIHFIDPSIPLESFIKEYELKTHTSFFWVPEGGSCEASLPGALTLSKDIQRNEKQHHMTFDHIYIDAGTGFIAAALLAGLGALKKNTHLHIVQMAGGDLSMHAMIEETLSWFQTLYKIKPQLPSFDILLPTKGKAFGSISQSHMQFISHFAKLEGILLDPIYNAKLFITAKEHLQKEKKQGNVLIIESGGTFTLSGFTKHLNKTL
ncbi:MAG: pyridoxal-phosphate dependent enzyme [Chlamydiae bacterium]|nr:pyridoxal-phosphate dependent enzyme [Chlamydiota bacterium]